MRLHIFSGKQSKKTLEKTLWGELNQVQTVWGCMLYELYEETFIGSLWRKINKRNKCEMWRKSWKCTVKEKLGQLKNQYIVIGGFASFMLLTQLFITQQQRYLNFHLSKHLKNFILKQQILRDSNVWRKNLGNLNEKNINKKWES